MNNVNFTSLIRLTCALFVSALSSIGLITFLLDGKTLTVGGALRATSYSVSVLVVLWALFVRYGWRWSVFRRWLVLFPDIEGTWVGTIKSTWVNPETQEKLPPIPVMLKVRQTLLRINCVMQNAEMTSRSFACGFTIDPEDQLRRLVYSYHATPRANVAQRNPQHDGTMRFDLIGQPVRKLVGEYWTKRGTTGDITLEFHCRELLDEIPVDLGPHPMAAMES